MIIMRERIRACVRVYLALLQASPTNLYKQRSYLTLTFTL